ncbi:MAG: hypothetical protein RBT59_11555 [Arcobacteraceae bacterium]|nr:hypothetical protein [Arcobacteraceae bacterium]
MEEKKKTEIVGVVTKKEESRCCPVPSFECTGYTGATIEERAEIKRRLQRKEKPYFRLAKSS